MKKIFSLCFAALLMTACTETDDTKPDSGQKTPEVLIETPEVIMPEIMEGTVSSKAVDFSSSVPWTLSLSNTKSAPTWFSVSPTSGNAGKSTITITIKEDNPLYEDRNAFIVLNTNGVLTYITVSQKKKEAILVSKDRYDFSSNTESFAVEVKSNVNYQVLVPDDFKEWLKHKKNNLRSGGLTSSIENFEVTEGYENGKREGFIIFKSGNLADTVKVFQAMKNALTLNQDQLNVPFQGNEALEVEVRTNTRYSITIPDSIKSWVTVVEPKGRAIRVDRFYLKVAKNTTYGDRKGEITVKDMDSDLSTTLTIQQAQENAIILSNKKVEVEATGGTVEVEVQSNIAYQIKILGVDTTKWIKRLPTSRALNREIVKFSVDALTNTKSRQSKIVFENINTKTSDTLVVNQMGIEKKLYLDYKVVEFGSNGHSLSVGINKNSEEIAIQVIIPDSLKWIKISMQASKIEKNKEYYMLHIDENQSYKPRKGIVIFKDKNSHLADTLLVRHHAKGGLIVEQKKYLVGYKDTIINVSVQANVEYEIVMPQNVDWVIESKTRSLDKFNHKFNIKQNPTYDNRTAEISFRSKYEQLPDEVFTIEQKAGSQGVIEEHTKF